MMNHWMQDVDDMFRVFTPVVRTTSPEFARNRFSPSVDVRETEKEYLFQFDLPGMTEKEIELSVTGRELHVSGERKQENENKDWKTHRSERFFGSFERTFVLPEEANAEKTEANFKNGVLEIRVPKVEAVQPKTIPIRAH
jgi:HSP20 family protein